MTLPFRVIDLAPTPVALAGRPALLRWAHQPGNALHLGQWGLVVLPTAPTTGRASASPTWLADLHRIDETAARRAWARWHAIRLAGCHLALVRAWAQGERAGLEAPPLAPGAAQLELAHAAPAAFPHARLCVDCGGPVELYPGRDGRPRVACEACRPPEWPRRGETWWLGPVRVLVLGSRMVRPAPDAPRARRVRCRAVEGGERFVVTGADWRRRASRRAPEPTAGEAA